VNGNSYEGALLSVLCKHHDKTAHPNPRGTSRKVTALLHGIRV
jgi:hypothetical protein